MKKIVTNAALVIIMLINASAQSDFVPGYIITNEFDTLYGLINDRGEMRNSRSCSFRLNEDSDTEEYEPGQIFGYRFEKGKYYITKEVPVNDNMQTLFLEYIVDGIADLYYFREEDGVHYYIQKEDMRMVELTNEVKTYVIDGERQITRQSKRYIGVLRAVLVDCNEIQPEINDVKFTHKALAGITHKYHDYVCIDGQECISYIKDVKTGKIDFGPQFSWNVSKLFYSLHSGGTPDPVLYGALDFKSNFPSAGMRLELSSKRVSKIFGLLLESEVGKSNYTVHKTVITLNREEIVDAYKNSLFGSAVLSINYNYFRGVVRPYASIGAGSMLVITEEGMRNYESYTGSELTLEAEYDDIPFTRASFLLRGQMGLKLQTDRPFVPFMGCRFDYLYSRTHNDTYAGSSLLPYDQNILSIAISGGIMF